jgi:D-alanyl-D-alanine carboxypeptidase
MLPRWVIWGLAASNLACQNGGQPDAGESTSSASAATTDAGDTSSDVGSSSETAADSTTSPSTTEESTGTTGPQDCFADVAAVELAVEAYRDATGAVGLGLVVARTGCEPLARTWGLADAASNEVLTEAHVLRAGSTTKMYTAALVLRLAEAELLALDDSLETWALDVPDASAITIRHLLNQTSGLPDYQANDAFRDAIVADPERVWTPMELVDLALELPAVGRPGAAHHYSNTNYILAGVIIESAAGTTFADAMRTHVLDPIGAVHTYVEADETWTEPTATGHASISMGAPMATTGLYHASQLWASGAVVTTVDELREWTSTLLATDFLAPQSQAELVQLVSTTGSIEGYGLGIFAIESATGTLYGHNGAVMGFQCATFHQPGTNTTITVMQNHLSLDANGGLAADPMALLVDVADALPR